MYLPHSREETLGQGGGWEGGVRRSYSCGLGVGLEAVGGRGGGEASEWKNPNQQQEHSGVRSHRGGCGERGRRGLGSWDRL